MKYVRNNSWISQFRRVGRVYLPTVSIHLGTKGRAHLTRLAPIIGPTLGGWITQNGPWRWLFLSAVKDYNSQQIGQVMAVPGAAMLLTLPLLRIVRRRLDSRVCLAIGLSLFAWALWINARLTASIGFDDLFWPQVLRGTAIMMCLSPIAELALGRLPLAAIPNATGLYTLMRTLGGGIGIAVINFLVLERSGFHSWRLAERLNPDCYPEYLEALQTVFAGRMADLDLAGQGGIRMVVRLVRREALLMAYNDAWLLVAALFMLMLMLVPIVRRVKV